MFLRVCTSHVTVGFGTLAFTALSFAATAHAGGDPRGIWYDHNGRGAVQIKECASNAKRLCGHVVYVKKARHKKRCGQQIVGNVKRNGRGWIYSPQRGRSYPLAMKRLSKNRLRIVGNAGSFFTKTYVWKRAPDSVINCANAAVAKAKVKPAAKSVTQTPKAVSSTGATPDKKTTMTATTTDTTDTSRPTNNASSATAALLASPRVAKKPPPQPTRDEIQAGAQVSDGDTNTGDDLSPPGGLSSGGGDKLAKLESVIKKFTGGKGLKGLKGLKVRGKSRGRCKYRIPYVGRTIRVKC